MLKIFKKYNILSKYDISFGVMNIVILLSIFLIIITTISTVHALPAPMEEDEMLKSSDFVGVVYVLGVTQIQNDTIVYQNRNVKQYNAWVQVLSHIKGVYDDKDTLIYCWREPPTEKLLGSWFIKLKKGEKAKMYLKFNTEKMCYEAVSWTAKKAWNSKKID